MDWKKFFDSIGLNGTRWQWRMMRLEQRFAEWKAGWGDKKEHVTYQHKFCGQCKALLDRDETKCPHCGTKAPNWRAQSVQRAFAVVTPQWVSVSSLLFLATLVVSSLAEWSPWKETISRAASLFPPLFYEGQHWRVITYGYVHGGPIHLLFNMIVLLQVGPAVEREIGAARFIVLYTFTLVTGGIADLVFRASVPIHIVGASGALFGLIGFGISYSHFHGGHAARMQRNFFLQWAAYGFIFGLMVGADNIAHGGGLAGGLLLGYLLQQEGRRRASMDKLWNALAALSIIATLLSLAWMGLVVFAAVHAA